ncbi:MAG: hypothetical protein E7256_16465 [Lachnospiraceae bacterium]|nr:hypothetical protein [Lachnospiraceae bacterium]
MTEYYAEKMAEEVSFMKNVLNDLFRLLPYLAAVYAGIYIVFRIRKKPCSRGHIICSLLFTLGVVGIFAITGVTPMSGFHTDLRMEEVNLVPFYGIVDMLGSAIKNKEVEYAAANIIGNVMLFVPF